MWKCEMKNVGEEVSEVVAHGHLPFLVYFHVPDVCLHDCHYDVIVVVVPRLFFLLEPPWGKVPNDVSRTWCMPQEDGLQMYEVFTYLLLFFRWKFMKTTGNNNENKHLAGIFSQLMCTPIDVVFLSNQQRLWRGSQVHIHDSIKMSRSLKVDLPQRLSPNTSVHWCAPLWFIMASPWNVVKTFCKTSERNLCKPTSNNES